MDIGKKHHSIVSDLRDSAGYPNIHDLTEVGAHPYRQVELLRDWINRHLCYGFAKPGSLGEGTFFGTDVIVIWFDAHNGLQMSAKQYTGLGYISPLERQFTRHATC